MGQRDDSMNYRDETADSSRDGDRRMPFPKRIADLSDVVVEPLERRTEGEGQIFRMLPRKQLLEQDVDLLQYAKTIFAERRARDAVLPEELVGEPAYDLLLDGYIARAEQRDVSVTSACVAAGGALTTALRWVARLEHLGLYERRHDLEDRRRMYVRLTNAGMELVTQSLRAQQKAYLRVLK